MGKILAGKASDIPSGKMIMVSRRKRYSGN